MGMAAFAAGLASPFFFLAMFPSYLKKLPKSGGWLVRVKVVMAFFVFAMMVKYFSNVDLVLHWEFLTRERFLALWVVLHHISGQGMMLESIVQALPEGQWRFSGAEDLGKAYGVYRYEGKATATNFYSTYKASFDHGTFQMTRPKP